MAIENYMPDFAVEAVYDLTVTPKNESNEQLRNLGLITFIGL